MVLLRNLLFYILIGPLTAFFGLWSIYLPGADIVVPLWARILVGILPVKIRTDFKTLDAQKNCVILANHQSYLDIPILYGQLGWKRRMRFVAKDSLFKIPVFGKGMTAVGHISIDRGNSRAAMKSIGRAVESAKSGNTVVVFPEGTRNLNLEKLMDFKIGGIILALKCGLPIVPVVICGAGDALGKDENLIKAEEIRVKSLPPVDPSGYTLKDRERFKADMYEIMNKAYQEMRRERH